MCSFGHITSLVVTTCFWPPVKNLFTKVFTFDLLNKNSPLENWNVRSFGHKLSHFVTTCFWIQIYTPFLQKFINLVSIHETIVWNKIIMLVILYISFKQRKLSLCFWSSIRFCTIMLIKMTMQYQVTKLIISIHWVVRKVPLALSICQYLHLFVVRTK